MKISFCLSLVLFTFALTACLVADKEEETKEEIPGFSRVDGLFVQEIDEEGNTLTVFKTNNKQYWSHEGMTLWTVWGQAEDDFKERTVEIAKAYGYSGAGCGIVFSQGEYEIDEKIASVMLVAMINNEGKYILGKAYGGIFVDFGWWKMTPYLNKGTGVFNEIKISYDESEREYSFFINGYEIERFKDEEEPALHKGRNGYIVVTTPYDNFPSSAVDVLFKEKM